ncbi:MAG: hypothetical protein JHD28_04470, partial [Bacteroidia bacterium]|nr:hypothetical protein [Bacteroidia bacterium]
FKIGLEKFSILKNRENELCKLHEVALDRFNLYQVEPELVNELTEFIKETKENVLLEAKNIIEINDVNAPILKLNPFVINENKLQAFFDSDYAGKVITIESNHKILSFLSTLEIKDSGGSWYTIINKNQLIINQDGKLDFIKRVCFPIELGVANDSEFKNVLIHNDVY